MDLSVCVCFSATHTYTPCTSSFSLSLSVYRLVSFSLTHIFTLSLCVCLSSPSPPSLFSSPAPPPPLIPPSLSLCPILHKIHSHKHTEQVHKSKHYVLCSWPLHSQFLCIASTELQVKANSLGKKKRKKEKETRRCRNKVDSQKNHAMTGWMCFEKWNRFTQFIASTKLWLHLYCITMYTICTT